MCNLKDYDELSLSKERRDGLASELNQWHKEYLPVKETVLDVGAGSGETAFFYLSHGAKHIVCIESNPDEVYNILQNIPIMKKRFGDKIRIDIVRAMIGSIKIDIEGYEEGMVMEYHFPHRWKTLRRPNRYTSIARLEKIGWAHRLIGKAPELPVIT